MAKEWMKKLESEKRVVDRVVGGRMTMWKIIGKGRWMDEWTGRE